MCVTELITSFISRRGPLPVLPASLQRLNGSLSIPYICSLSALEMLKIYSSAAVRATIDHAVSVCIQSVNPVRTAIKPHQYPIRRATLIAIPALGYYLATRATWGRAPSYYVHGCGVPGAPVVPGPSLLSIIISSLLLSYRCRLALSAAV